MAGRQIPQLDENPKKEMSTTRDSIFKSIRNALEPLPERTPRPEVPHGVADAQWLDDEVETIALFQKRAGLVGSLTFTDAAACAQWLTSENPGKVYIPAEFSELIPIFSNHLSVTSSYSRADANTINACLSPAAAGIAESGTIVLTDKSTPDRLAALAPWYHIAILRRSDIHRSIADALAAMPNDPNIIWVTGPSKTADVEGILIQGVHGPGVQVCLIL